MGNVTPMRKGKAAAKPAAEVEELDLDDLELDGLEELDDVDLETEPEPEAEVKKVPAKKAVTKKAKPAPQIEFSEHGDEIELDFEEEETEEAPAPTPVVTKKTTPKTATRKTARDVAQEEETDMAEYLRGFAAGKYGVNLSREDAERVDATLKAAEQDHTGNLFAYLVGSGVTETASATVIKSPGVTQVVSKAPRATKAQTRAAAATALKTAKKPAAKSSGDLDMKAVRTWAQSNGYALGDRGRIPAEIQDAYRAAN